MNESLENASDAELLNILRMADNTDIPGSRHQRAQTEWQIRHAKRMIDASKNGRGGIVFEVGGDMTNHGVIQTGANATVDIAVAGNYSSNDKTKIIQGIESGEKEWYEKPFGMVLLTVIASTITAGAVFYFGWS